MPFLTKDYQVPQTGGGYMNLEEGDNKVRFLTMPVVGQEYWIELGDGNRKPKRVPENTNINIGEIAVNKWGNPSLKPWWGVAVWNYKTSSIQILNITQKDVIKELNRLYHDEDWGDFREYDLVITRQNGEQTNYSVRSKPHKAVDPEILAKFKAMNIDMEAMYVSEENPYGGNPFGGRAGKVVRIDPSEVDIDNKKQVEEAL